MWSLREIGQGYLERPRSGMAGRMLGQLIDEIHHDVAGYER